MVAGIVKRFLLQEANLSIEPPLENNSTDRAEWKCQTVAICKISNGSAVHHDTVPMVGVQLLALVARLQQLSLMAFTLSQIMLVLEECSTMRFLLF